MSYLRPYRVTGIAGLLGCLIWPSTAIAQPAPQGERAAAEVMFEAGREAMADKNYDLACEKFEASMKLDPAPGTLMNLGNCEEKRGRIASAWERYIAAQRELPTTDRRKVFAAKKVAELEPDVPRLTITLAADAPEGTEIRRAEIDLTGSLGVPLPLDPGTYELTVTAKGHAQRTFEIAIGLGETKDLEVWPGEKLPEPKKTKVDSNVAEPVQWGPLNKRQWGYVAGGVGIAGLATMATTGLLAWNAKSTVDEHCGKDAAGEAICDPTGDEAKQNGATYATVADVAGAVGIAALGAGIYLVVTSTPSENSASEPPDKGSAEPNNATSRVEVTSVEVGSFAGYHGLRLRGQF